MPTTAVFVYLFACFYVITITVPLVRMKIIMKKVSSWYLNFGRHIPLCTPCTWCRDAMIV